MQRYSEVIADVDSIEEQHNQKRNEDRRLNDALAALMTIGIQISVMHLKPPSQQMVRGPLCLHPGRPNRSPEEEGPYSSINSSSPTPVPVCSIAPIGSSRTHRAFQCKPVMRLGTRAGCTSS